LTLAGSGTLVLGGANTYTGGTTVAGGTLLVNGSLAAGTVNVNGGALGGTGTTGPVSVGAAGTLAPGAGGGNPGVLTTGNLVLNSGSAFNAVLDGASPGAGGYSQLVANGTINLGGATLNLTLGFTPALGQSFTLIKNGGKSAVTGTFNGLPEGSTLVVNGMTFQITYVGGSGHDVVLTRTV
jgi:autotransporter-associated beta strand protein